MDEAAILAALTTGRPLEKLARPERWARVLWLRYGAESPATWSHIARELGVTTARVQQIAAEACRHLRHPSRRSEALALTPPGSPLALAVWGLDY